MKDSFDGENMGQETSKKQLREVGVTAWRATVLAVATLLVLILYLGMVFLVYRGQMSDGPLILFTGVLLGYLLRSARGKV